MGGPQRAGSGAVRSSRDPHVPRDQQRRQRPVPRRGRGQSTNRLGGAVWASTAGKTAFSIRTADKWYADLAYGPCRSEFAALLTPQNRVPLGVIYYRLSPLRESESEPMLARRIIPCLDVKEGRVVKGVNFLNFRDAGDPAELAARYDAMGADELVFLDITASHEHRDVIVESLPGSRNRFSSRSLSAAASDRRKTSAIPACRRGQGGSQHGGDPAARNNHRGRGHFGSQCVVVAIDPKRVGEYPDGSSAVGSLHPRRQDPHRRRRVGVGRSATERGAGEIF